MDNDITNKRVWNTKQMITIVGGAISITFGLTMIWGRFLFMENKIDIFVKEVQEIKVLVEDSKIYTNERLDKISSRNKDAININAKDIEKLKLPNTDK